MNVPWGIHRRSDVIGYKSCQTRLPDGRWVRAVPLPYTGNRLRAVWWILTGRAYAIRWPQAGELEKALDE